MKKAAIVVLLIPLLFTLGCLVKEEYPSKEDTKEDTVLFTYNEYGLTRYNVSGESQLNRFGRSSASEVYSFNITHENVSSVEIQCKWWIDAAAMGMQGRGTINYSISPPDEDIEGYIPSNPVIEVYTGSGIEHYTNLTINVTPVPGTMEVNKKEVEKMIDFHRSVLAIGTWEIDFNIKAEAPGMPASAQAFWEIDVNATYYMVEVTEV